MVQTMSSRSFPELLSPKSARSADVVDILERGLAKEYSVDVLSVSARSKRMRYCYVVRSADRQQFTLYLEEDDSFQLYSWVDGLDIYFSQYLPTDEAFDPNNFCAVLRAHPSRRQYTLFNRECEGCDTRYYSCSSSPTTDRQELAHLVHSVKQIGDGVLNYMDVIIPGLNDDNSRVCWCPRTQASSVPRQRTLSQDKQREDEVRLKSKLPSWNEKLETLVLDFKGRVSQSSAKNFQLSLDSNKDVVVLQFGKIAEDTFVLDYRHPLCMLQAFAFAMSTFTWT
eukprot:GILK01002382.1.p1 GENE.GILK01002382.1~~GILK01002382.1.p1  ORF type:complete len:282 (+),score=22.97 GILK01002382.1:119-964(+)